MPKRKMIRPRRSKKIVPRPEFMKSTRPAVSPRFCKV
jgi:hypothetical protein